MMLGFTRGDKFDNKLLVHARICCHNLSFVSVDPEEEEEEEEEEEDQDKREWPSGVGR